jgi:hypothetical protein
MNEKRTFSAVIQKANRGGAYAVVPFDLEKAFKKKRVKVKAIIDGELYRGSLVRMGGPDHILGILKEIRERIGKSFGDEVEISVEEDTEPRQIKIPQDLKKSLKSDPVAEAFFKKLSFSHKRQ